MQMGEEARGLEKPEHTSPRQQGAPFEGAERRMQTQRVAYCLRPACSMRQQCLGRLTQYEASLVSVSTQGFCFTAAYQPRPRVQLEVEGDLCLLLHLGGFDAAFFLDL